MSKGTPDNGGTPANGPDKSRNTGRTIDGKFAPGNDGMGGGRPRAKRSIVMEQALDAALTPDKAKQIVTKMVKCAIDGESWACKELIDRCVGKAKESLELTGSFTLTEFYRALGTHLRAG